MQLSFSLITIDYYPFHRAGKCPRVAMVMGYCSLLTCGDCPLSRSGRVPVRVFTPVTAPGLMLRVMSDSDSDSTPGENARARLKLLAPAG